jgi:hypothetical protein
MGKKSRKQKQPNADKDSYESLEIVLGRPSPRGTSYTAVMRCGKTYRVNDKGQVTLVSDAQ